ncbi:MAG TPA: DUF4231 domain-containing protein [Halothiobacillaceae bacterium]|nr:DUF4231 domain-containing protein [Halothiobacillaceae bacterium]
MSIDKDALYPALYKAADKASNDAQKRYLLLIKVEFSLLFIAAVLAMDWAQSKTYYVLYAIVFILATLIFFTRLALKPEQNWYQCRSLAESIKTSTWRYVMRSEPFVDSTSINIARAEFRNLLREILRTNSRIGAKISDSSSAEDQITEEMDRVRRQDLEQRKQVYKENRISEQQIWYTGKAADNKLSFYKWSILLAIVYTAAITLVLWKIAEPQWDKMPIYPLIVLATAIVGWMQIKKFNELTSSYTLTAIEIGIIKGKIDEVDEEAELSEFVNEAELAFSREHTQWVARQHD